MTAYRIQDYRMEYVYLRITEAQRQEVMALWQSTQIVPDAAERERRRADHSCRKPQTDASNATRIKTLWL